MDLKQTQENWNLLGETDPLYGVLSQKGKRGGKWDEAEFFATGVAEIAGLFEQAQRLNLTFPRRRALDFGCAVGRLSQALAGHFDEVTGVDIAPAMLKRAESYNKFGTRCRYLLNENPDLKIFADASFDLIYTNIVLQHMAPEFALSYIGEFVRTLSADGLLVFQVPPRPQYSPLRRILKRLLPAGLLFAYRKLRYGNSTVTEAEIEMNGVPPEAVLARVEAAGAVVLHHEQGWYWVKKLFCVAAS
jgi:SAM-dependent methyltransferase